MILDSLKSLEKYQTLQSGFDKAYQFVKSNNLHSLAPGEYEIDGKNVYCKIWEGDLKGMESPKLEVHDSYIDIHILLNGTETIGVKDRGRCGDEYEPYNESEDIAFYNDEPENYVVLGVDNMAIIFPADAHAPLIGEGTCKKAIIKVNVAMNPKGARF